ncbi:MAG: hypothetical protein AB7O28_14595 [Vicinamibacterales bacterium]
MIVSRLVSVAVLAALMATPAAGQAFDAALDQARAQAAGERDRERAERDRERAAREVDRERREYERALDALEDAEWTQALTRFQALADQAGARADGALYWRAYALDKLGRQADALTAIADLARRFPKSRWIGDARALEVQVRARVGQPVVVDASGDDELKLLALNALQSSAPEQALPLLRQVLQGTQSLKLKERALFVLAQSDSPEARRLMSEVARQGNPDLQRKAIDYLGVHGNSENRALLAELYGAADDDIKRRVLRAYMVAGDRARVLAAATGESNAALRAEAVRQLGVMGAHDELWQLYGKERDADVKREILQAMFVGGDAPRLIQLAKTETDPALRRTAVRNLGLMRASATGPALVEIYASQAPAEVKAAVVQGLFVQNNAEALVGLARKETDPARKKDLVQKLSVMKSKAAVDYLLELLGK